MGALLPPQPPFRLVAECFEPEQESLDVFLAIPHYRERGLNIASARRDTETRYRAEFEMVRDENTGTSEKPVQVARKNFRLLVEGEAREGNSTMRVARVRRTPARPPLLLAALRQSPWPLC